MEQLQEILTKVGFDWRLALANLINFLIIFWILKRFFFGPISEAIEKRRKTIEGGLEDAKAGELALKSANEERDRIIQEAKTDAEEIIIKAREQAKLIDERARKKVLELRDETLEKAKHDIERERSDLYAAVRREAAELVAQGVRRAVGEDLDNAAKSRIRTRLARS